MKERSLKRTSVLVAVLFGLVTALTGFALFFGGGSTHASADPAPTEKALYFVDAGRMVMQNTVDSTYEMAIGREHTRDNGGATFWRRSTPFMDEYGFAYSSDENPDGLLNRVADKPFFVMA
ncbi:MAG: hypothetical protein K2M95_05910, partial [Clostridiales bacterium]|nr:hypothetical protein [Clostridiales bacterium]